MRISDWSSDVCSSDLHADRGITHHHVGEPEHGLGDAAERLHEWVTMSGRQRRQRKTKQHREEDDRQDVAVRDRREHVRWYEVENRRHQAVRTVLHFGGGLRSEEHTSELQSLMRIS